jgi:CopG family transcriptional regulator, nickel-responsive regulator
MWTILGGLCNTSDMERLTISLDDSLAEAFDAWLGQHGYANRSEAFRDLIRSTLGAEQQRRQPDGLCAASLSYVYNHHERALGTRLMALQHAAHDLVVSSTRAHLGHDHCIETLLLRGAASRVRQLAVALCAEKGVHHGQLNLIPMVAHDSHRHGPGTPGHSHLKPQV